MSFSKKTSSSPSSDSDTEDDQQQEQPPQRHRNIPSGLSIFSDIINIQRPANILESIDVKSSGIIPANPTDSGYNPAPVDAAAPDEVRNADDRTGLFRIGAGRKGRYEMCTESLGFESLAEKMDLRDDLTEESLSQLRSRSRMTMCGAVREKTNLSDFPPLLSTLDESGRPRFDFKKVRNDGRLEITMVENDKPVVVRTRGRDGELRMEIVKRDQQEEEEEEEREDSKVGEEERREG